MTAVQLSIQGVITSTITTMAAIPFFDKAIDQIQFCRSYYGRAACKHAQKRLEPAFGLGTRRCG